MFSSSNPTSKSFVTTKDGTQLYVKDWGKGPAVVFLHGYPLSSDAWEDHMFFLSRNGYRTIAYDRRGFGRSSQPDHGYDYDTFANDLETVLKSFNLEKVTLIGHSMGGGEIARYIANYGQKRIVKVAFISAVTPFLLQTEDNPNGVPKSVFDSFRSSVLNGRSKWNLEVAVPYYSTTTKDKEVDESTLKGLQNEYWRQGQATGLPAAYHAIAAFSETDFRGDIKKITVPTLVIHGDNDQIVPFTLSGKLTAEIIPNAKLIVYEGGSHGLIHQEKEKLSQDLLEFLKQ